MARPKMARKLEGRRATYHQSFYAASYRGDRFTSCAQPRLRVHQTGSLPFLIVCDCISFALAAARVDVGRIGNTRTNARNHSDSAAVAKLSDVKKDVLFCFV